MVSPCSVGNETALKKSQKVILKRLSFRLWWFTGDFSCVVLTYFFACLKGIIAPNFEIKTASQPLGMRAFYTTLFFSEKSDWI